MPADDNDITDDQKAEVLTWMAQYSEDELPAWLKRMRRELIAELHAAECQFICGACDSPIEPAKGEVVWERSGPYMHPPQGDVEAAAAVAAGLDDLGVFCHMDCYH